MSWRVTSAYAARQLRAANTPSLSAETAPRPLGCTNSNRLIGLFCSRLRGNHMMPSQKILKSRKLTCGFVMSSLVLGICFANLPAAAQSQPSQNTTTVQQQDGQPTPDAVPQNAVPANQVAPATITLPAGTMIPVRLTEWLSSDKNQSGDQFSATIEQPLVANGWVVAVRGQIVTGRVAQAKKAGRVSGVSQLGVELSELTLVDGQVLPVRTQLLQSSAGTSNGRDAGAVGTRTRTPTPDNNTSAPVRPSRGLTTTLSRGTTTTDSTQAFPSVILDSM